MARTVPVMPSESPGYYLTGALWAASVKALGDFVTAKPIFFGYQATAQSIPNNAFTAVSLDSESVDSDGGHSTSTNTSRYVFQVAGRYRVHGIASFTANATGIRAVKLNVNGSGVVISSEQIVLPTGSVASTVLTSVPVLAAVGDYVELLVYQNSGAALNTVSNASMDYVTSLAVEFTSN